MEKSKREGRGKKKERKEERREAERMKEHTREVKISLMQIKN